jgi:hypothetical protein
MSRPGRYAHAEQIGRAGSKESISLGPLSPVVSAEPVSGTYSRRSATTAELLLFLPSGKLLWLIYRLLPTLFLWLSAEGLD